MIPSVGTVAVSWGRLGPMLADRRRKPREAGAPMGGVF
jgi:hypothetical protein